MATKRKENKPTRKTARVARDRNPMPIELNDADRALLDDLVDRYRKVAHDPNKVFVIRQLIRNASESKELPPLKLP